MPSKAAMQAMQKITAGPEPLAEEKRMELLEKSMAKYTEESKKSTVFDKDVSDLVARFEKGGKTTIFRNESYRNLRIFYSPNLISIRKNLSWGRS